MKINHINIKNLIWAICSSLFLMQLAAPIQAQDLKIDSTLRKAQTFEIGLNITSTISSFLGNGSVLNPDPYLISAKWIKGKHGIRTGFYINLEDSKEVNTDFGGVRKVKEFELKTRVGYENRVYINKYLDLYWGFDLISLYNNSEVNFDSAIGGSSAFLKNESIGIGTGPVLGIALHLNKRLMLSTESTLYGLYTYTKEREYAPPVTNASNSDAFSIKATLPSSLYLVIKF